MSFSKILSTSTKALSLAQKRVDDLAIEAIKLLELSMQEKLGMREVASRDDYEGFLKGLRGFEAYKVGIEVEGFAPIEDKSFSPEKLSADLTDAKAEIRRWERFYQEGGSTSDYFHGEFVTAARSPLASARAIGLIRKLATDPKRINPYGLGQFSFDSFHPYIDNNNQACGMHVSVSLNKDGRNLIHIGDGEESQKTIRKLSALAFHAISEKAQELLFDSTLLWASSDDSFKRIFGGSKVVPTNTYASIMKGGGIRLVDRDEDGKIFPPERMHVEVRTAGADANPFLATLAAMALVYRGVSAKVKIDSNGELQVAPSNYRFPFSKIDFPKSLAEARDIFEKSDNSFRVLLDELSGDRKLGTELSDVYLKYMDLQKNVGTGSKVESVLSR